ncbi:hypothetical protein EKE94_09250 [Mesobaculum littorinae]|uniref:Peptidase S9 prolyl oligopeptidase catalytic domain-containing protein n=1 Tax=Mesobaculum littorinae TaxID=2486419 RepID=A0A438AG68_9RHOB|nr:hypothetical protein [Mesobaculum littorinae]RVV97684.1 hypothetical protein EKE94_09250 [Mesobaculum littorinae]
MSKTDLASSLSESGAFDVEVQGGKIPVNFKRAGSKTRIVIFSFHGAIDRTTRRIPAYAPFLPGIGNLAHQVSVSDPTMLVEGSFSMSWYAGHEGFKTQDILKQVFEDIIEALDVDKVIFLGASSGGFASLYYSWHFPGSVCVAACPQTCLALYYKRHVDRYLAEGWPSMSGIEALSNTICTDVGALYSQRIPNTVIYLQSTGDHKHFVTQLIPFLSNLKVTDKDRSFILNSGYWGKLGHSGSVPREAFMPWIKAILMSQVFDADALMQTHYELNATPGKIAAPSSAPRQNKDDFAAADIELASKITAWQHGRA